MSSEKSKLSSVHNVSDSVKVDPREEYSNIGDRMTVIHYKRLVVPANMRSIYWKCYGFPANEENEILTRTKIVCLLCKTQITYNRNTSNLRMHLQNKHKPELETLELVQPLPHNKGGTTDKRSSKKSKKTIKQEQVMQVFPASTQDDQCFSEESDKRKRKVKAAVRFGDWVSDKDLENVCEYVTDISEPDPGISANSQYVAEVDDMNPLRVIVKEATSNQTYTLVDGKIIAEAISDFIIMDLQSPEVVEGKGFQRLLATLKSPCEIPSKARLIEEIIPKMYDTVRDHLQPQIAALKCDISLSIDDWIAANGDTYSTVSLHYINDTDSDLQSRILTTIYCSEVDPLVWGAQFDAMMDEWEVKRDQIRAIVISSDREEVYDSLIARNFTLVPCLSYALQSAVTKAVFSDPEIVPVLQKCRGLIALISRCSSALTSLRMQESLLQLEDNTFCPDSPPAWLSTYNMIEQLHIRKAILPTVLESLSPSIGSTVTVDFTTAQWELIDCIIAVLSPFKVTMVTLSEEKTPLISLLKPILWQLLHVHLQASGDDLKSVVKFKAALSDALRAKYCDPKVNRILDLAAILDPRFKTLSFMDESEKPALQSLLKELLLQQCSQVQCNEIKQEQLIKKQRISGMEYLLGNLCAPKSGMPVQQRAEVEMVQYECEAPASLEKSPIDAWKELSSKCVQLSRLAHSYLCTPSCVVDHLNRCFTPNPVLNSLSPSLSHKLKFLHRNYNPIGSTQE